MTPSVSRSDARGTGPQVREGMPVVDSTGREVGTVAHVAVEEPGEQAPARLEVLADLAGGFTGAPTPSPAQRLVRPAHLFVRLAGPHAEEVHVEGGHVRALDGDRVLLDVPLAVLRP